MAEHPAACSSPFLLCPRPQSSQTNGFGGGPSAYMLMQPRFRLCRFRPPRRTPCRHGRQVDWDSRTWEWLKTFALTITNTKAVICWIVTAGVLAFLLRAAASTSPSPSRRSLVRLLDLRRPGRNHLFGAELLWRPPRRDRSLRARWRVAGLPHADARFDHARRAEPRSHRRPRSLDLLPSHRAGGRGLRRLKLRDTFRRHGHIGVVGLGTGSVAAYPRPGQ